MQQADKAHTSTRWATSDGIATYGGASALWDEGEVGFSTWTASDINNSGFGVVIATTISDVSEEGFVILSIDHIQVTVTYSILLEVNACWPIAMFIVAQRSRHKPRQKDESDKWRPSWR